MALCVVRRRLYGPSCLAVAVLAWGVIPFRPVLGVGPFWEASCLKLALIIYWLVGVRLKPRRFRLMCADRSTEAGKAQRPPEWLPSPSEPALAGSDWMRIRVRIAES